MERFIQAAAGGVLTVLLGIALSKQSKDIALVLAVGACCMILGVMLSYLEPVLDFLQELQQLGQLDDNVVRILFKALGISIVAEIAALICSDAGNSALGKAIQVLAVAAVLSISLPLLRGLLDTVQKILGDI